MVIIDFSRFSVFDLRVFLGSVRFNETMRYNAKAKENNGVSVITC